MFLHIFFKNWDSILSPTILQPAFPPKFSWTFLMTLNILLPCSSKWLHNRSFLESFSFCFSLLNYSLNVFLMLESLGCSTSLKKSECFLKLEFLGQNLHACLRLLKYIVTLPFPICCVQLPPARSYDKIYFLKYLKARFYFWYYNCIHSFASYI